MERPVKPELGLSFRPALARVYPGAEFCGWMQRRLQGERQVRRLINLISAGRNRTVMIRRELPRTKDAGWIRGSDRIERRRILLSVCASTAANSASACQNKSCHSLISGSARASPAGPVKAERSEPQGSLDGWRRCNRMQMEGMAGTKILYAACFWYLASVRTAIAHMNPSNSRPTAVTV